MSSKKTIKNIVVNLIGGASPILIGILAIPIAIKGLGTEAFGIMTIAWVVLGYFGLFDLGFAQATIKFASQFLAIGDKQNFSAVFWVSLVMSLVMGLLGAIIFILLTPSLIERFLKIPSYLLNDARNTFYLLSISLPLVIAISSLKGILASAHKFVLINKIQVPLNALTYLIPCLSLPFHFNLPFIVAMILLLRFIVIIVYLFKCFSLFPELILFKKFDINILKKMLSFGGWITLSNTISPLLVYLDRFVIGSLISMTAVTNYTAPYELIVRTRLFPNAIVDTLFPQFSSETFLGNRDKLANLFSNALKYIVLIMCFVILFAFTFSFSILKIWLGQALALNSVIVLKVLCLGVLFNAVATLPFFLLQSAGRPDLPAKFHAIELIIFALCLYYFVSKYGVIGAAIAWSIRSFIDCVFLFYATNRLFPYLFIPEKVRTIFFIVTTTLFLILVSISLDFPFGNNNQHLIISILLIGIFLLIAWKFYFDKLEKAFLKEKYQFVIAKSHKF